MILFVVLFLLFSLAVVGLYLGIVIVPEREVWIFERLGEFKKALGSGLHFTIPFLDRHKIVTKEVKKKDESGKIIEIRNLRRKAIVPFEKDINIDIDPIDMITKDNANIKIDTIIFIRIPEAQDTYDPGGKHANAVKAIYEVDDYQEGVIEATLTSLRNIVGNQTLNAILDNDIILRDKKDSDGKDIHTTIEDEVKKSVQKFVYNWGVTVVTFDIQKLEPGEKMREAMEKQAAAEREKNAMIQIAEGKFKAAELEAKAQLALAESSAQSMKLISEGLQGQEMPAMYLLGEKYINALGTLSESDNSKFVVYPADIQATIRGLTGNMLGGAAMGSMMGMGMADVMTETSEQNISEQKAKESIDVESKSVTTTQIKKDDTNLPTLG